MGFKINSKTKIVILLFMMFMMSNILQAQNRVVKGDIGFYDITYEKDQLFDSLDSSCVLFKRTSGNYWQKVYDKNGNLIYSLDVDGSANFAGDVTIDGTLFSTGSQLVYDVRDYGGDPSDEIDDLSAIQEAIDSCYANDGGIVYLCEGDWRISDEIIMKSNIEFCGAGTFATIITATAAMDQMINMSTGSLGAQHCHLHSFQLDANSGNATHGILCEGGSTGDENVKYNKFEHLTILTADSSGINFKNWCFDNDAQNVRIRFCKYGIWMKRRANDVNITECDLTDNTIWGLYCEALFECVGVSIERNHFEGNGLTGTTLEGAIFIGANANAVNVVGNYCENNTGVTIKSIGASCVIRGNYCIGNNSSDYSMIGIAANGSDEIVNNRVQAGGSHGYQTYAIQIDTNSTNVACYNNSFTDATSLAGGDDFEAINVKYSIVAGDQYKTFGIGKYDPNYSFMVYNNVAGHNNVGFSVQNGYKTSFNFMNTDTIRWSLRYNNNGNDCFQIVRHQANTGSALDAPINILPSNGYVGIDRVTPVSKLDINGNLMMPTSSYINFNGTDFGSSGYGFRDNAGTMQYKNSGGSWADIGSGINCVEMSAAAWLGTTTNGATDDIYQYIPIKDFDDAVAETLTIDFKLSDVFGEIDSLILEVSCGTPADDSVKYSFEWVGIAFDEDIPTDQGSFSSTLSSIIDLGSSANQRKKIVISGSFSNLAAKDRFLGKLWRDVSIDNNVSDDVYLISSIFYGKNVQ